jgi:hypothetical protein
MARHRLLLFASDVCFVAVSGAGIGLDGQNTAVEPVSFPGIATRTYLLPNVPNDCNMNHR